MAQIPSVNSTTSHNVCTIPSQSQGPYAPESWFVEIHETSEAGTSGGFPYPRSTLWRNEIDWSGFDRVHLSTQWDNAIAWYIRPSGQLHLAIGTLRHIKIMSWTDHGFDNPVHQSVRSLNLEDCVRVMVQSKKYTAYCEVYIDGTGTAGEGASRQ